MRGFAIALCLLSGTASAQGRSDFMPNDIDLKAMFCLGYFKGDNYVDPSKLPPEFRAEIERTNREMDDGLRRMRAYIVPRSRFLDAESLVAAGRAGEAYKTTQRQIFGDCLKDRETAQCQAMFKKVDECRTASFLPF